MNTTTSTIKQYVGLINKAKTKRNNVILLGRIVDKIYEDLQAYNNTFFGSALIAAVTKSAKDFIEKENQNSQQRYAIMAETEQCSSEQPIAVFALSLINIDDYSVTTLNLDLHSVVIKRSTNVFNLDETKYLSNVYPLLAKERMKLTNEIKRLREEMLHYIETELSKEA